MRLSTFAFYLAPLIVVPSTVAFFIYRKGGTELLVAQWPEQAGAVAMYCATSFICYKLDNLITGRKHAKARKALKEKCKIDKRKASGIRRLEPTIGETEL